MKTHTLTVSKRTVFGKKTKQLRREGKLPATIYGKDIKSISVECDAKQFDEIYKKAGETGVINITVTGEKKDTRPVLINTIQKHPVFDTFIHIEFKQVDLTKTVQASVPLVQIHESPAVEMKKGVLLTLIDSVDVEALPTDLPEQIDVDISSLQKEGDELTVKDLTIPPKVVLLTEESIGIVKIAPLVMQEEPEVVPEPEAAEGAEEVAAEDKEQKDEDQKEEEQTKKGTSAAPDKESAAAPQKQEEKK